MVIFGRVTGLRSLVVNVLGVLFATHDQRLVTLRVLSVTQLLPVYLALRHHRCDGRPEALFRGGQVAVRRV